MPSNSAEYQRAYRARKRLRDAIAAPQTPDEALTEAFATDYMILSNERAKRIVELEDEVKRLKAELAKRPMPGLAARPIVVADSQAAIRFNSQPFSGPIPKKR